MQLSFCRISHVGSKQAERWRPALDPSGRRRLINQRSNPAGGKLNVEQNDPDIFKSPSLHNPNMAQAWPRCFLTATRPLVVGLVSLGQTRACGPSASRPTLLRYHTGNGSKLRVRCLVVFFKTFACILPQGSLSSLQFIGENSGPLEYVSVSLQ